MSDFGVDGIYLDGTTVPHECKNYLHGCGYRDAQGMHQKTYPIFAVRNLMRRVYDICVRQHGGLISVHQSTCMTIPTMSFATSYWDGEQFNTPLKDEPLKILPLETFQAEFMGRNYGLPAEFLTYAPFVWTVDEALAFTLLHDVAIRPINVGPMLLSMSRIWRVQDQFDLDHADFVGYWNQDLARCDDGNVKISYYRQQAKNRLLLVVANLGSQRTNALLRIRLDNVNVKKATASDALTNESLVLNSDTLALTIEKMGFRMISLSTSN